MAQRFVILDRDGTIIEEKHHLTDPSQLVLIPGVGDALRKLTRLGFGLVLVTNQSPVGRGILTLERLEIIHTRLQFLLMEYGIKLSGIYYCPHTPQDDCACRKPRTGLVDRASLELDFDPAESFLIGDNISDIELGHNVGATTFLVRTGHGAEAKTKVGTLADYIVDDLLGAATRIEALLASSMSRKVRIRDNT